MSVKSICSGVVIIAFLGAGIARAQGPSSPSVGGEMPGLNTSPVNPGVIIFDGPQLPPNVPFYSGPQSLQTPGTDNTNQPQAGRATLSSWMLYPRSEGCCGPTGCCGPINAELFMNVGPSFNVGNGVLGHELGTGWDIEGGARALFFNPQCDKAWTVSFSVSNINNHAGDQTQEIPLTNFHVQGQVIPSLDVTIRSLNRTYANLGLGREWYIWGSARSDGINHGTLPNWRVGAEIGGRWGSSDLELNEIVHQTQTVEGTYIAIYTDIEYPWHCCVFTAGLRAEYGYTWIDLLQHTNNTDVQDINLLFTCGVRF